MRQKRTTLRRFIKNFPTKSLIIGNTFPSLKGLSYDEAFALYREPSRTYKVLSVKEDSIYYACKMESVSRHGNRFYKKSLVVDYLYINPTTIKINRKNPKFIRGFLELAKITWWRDLSMNVINYLEKPPILKSVLVKTIYNEETLYKAISKRIYGVNIRWRLMKEWLGYSGRMNISLIDLFTFTRNPEKGLERYMKEPFQMRTTLRDLLTMAVALNQIVDFTWSEQRILEEHQKQIELKLKREISSKSLEPVYKNVFDTPSNIVLLNTELDVFMEASKMHHCLYHSYWDRIVNHKYIAFHMTSPEECTFSIKNNVINKIPVFDQAHLVNNGCVSAETIRFIDTFITTNRENLEKMFEEGLEKLKLEDNTLEFVEELAF